LENRYATPLLTEKSASVVDLAGFLSKAHNILYALSTNFGPGPLPLSI